MANSVDPDQMSHYGASDLGLHCLLKPPCLKTKSKNGDCFYAEMVNLKPVLTSIG